MLELELDSYFQNWEFDLIPHWHFKNVLLIVNSFTKIKYVYRFTYTSTSTSLLDDGMASASASAIIKESSQLTKEIKNLKGLNSWTVPDLESKNSEFWEVAWLLPR
jgi:hypothetical protein